MAERAPTKAELAAFKWPRIDVDAHEWDVDEPEVSTLAARNPHPRDSKIKFRDKTHAYAIEIAPNYWVGKPYVVSVTTLLNYIKPDFYRESMLINCAKSQSKLAHVFTAMQTGREEEYLRVRSQCWASLSGYKGAEFEVIDSEETFERVKSKHFGKYPHLHYPDAPYTKARTDAERVTHLRNALSADWSGTSSTASTLGTKLHKDAELHFNGHPPRQPDSIEWQQFQNFLKDYPHFKMYRTEWRIFDEELLLTGTIDLIVRFDDGTFGIGDWKFVGNIFEGSDGKSSKKFKEPLDKLPYSKVMEYGMQLNSYRHMLEKKYEGMIVSQLFLVCMHRNQANYAFIPVPILKEETNALMDVHRGVLDDMRAELIIKARAPDWTPPPLPVAPPLASKERAYVRIAHRVDEIDEEPRKRESPPPAPALSVVAARAAQWEAKRGAMRGARKR